LYAYARVVHPPGDVRRLLVGCFPGCLFFALPSSPRSIGLLSDDDDDGFKLLSLSLSNLL